MRRFDVRKAPGPDAGRQPRRARQRGGHGKQLRHDCAAFQCRRSHARGRAHRHPNTILPGVHRRRGPPENHPAWRRHQESGRALADSATPTPATTPAAVVLAPSSGRGRHRPGFRHRRRRRRLVGQCRPRQQEVASCGWCPDRGRCQRGRAQLLRADCTGARCGKPALKVALGGRF